MPGKRSEDSTNPPLVAAKLAALDSLAPEFEASFPYVQEIHGHRRFQQLRVADVVRYLHALWVCECKDLLLSVPHTIGRYEGHRALELLAIWQQGETAEVVAFLQARLDTLPFEEITRQWQIAVRDADERRADRLAHGRLVLLNRGFNLNAALDAIFAPQLVDPKEQLRTASAGLGHTSEQISQQLAEMETDAYSYLPHPALARRNMLVMNALGVRVTDNAADRPDNRMWKVVDATLPALPYAQTLIAGEVEQLPTPRGSYGYFPDEDLVRTVLNTLAAPTLLVNGHSSNADN
jgi:hypothetical protein